MYSITTAAVHFALKNGNLKALSCQTTSFNQKLLLDHRTTAMFNTEQQQHNTAL